MTNHYVEIARIDHWFKNAFMLLGVVIAFFYKPSAFAWHSLPVLIAAFFITCLIASSNYVLNEIVDAPTDRFHPTKRQRPIPSGKVRPALAVLEWILLGSVGIVAAFHINAYFGSSAFAFWLMGLAYNVPPVRLKEYPYVDVLSESINNPIRLLLGWFSLIPDRFPPLSLALCYWMVGALFMATKRLAEHVFLCGDSFVLRGSLCRPIPFRAHSIHPSRGRLYRILCEARPARRQSSPKSRTAF
jgi:4-hydroxybenzoate polyprenyltransferase